MKCLCLLPALLFFTPVLAAETQLPVEARKLESDYLSSLEIAQGPIRERYLTELRKIYDQLVKAGKLEESLAIKAEIGITMAQPLLGRWNDTVGVGIIDLLPGGEVANTNGSAGRWTVDGDLLRITWDNGWKHEFPLVRPGPTLRGHVINPAGDRKPFSETRPRGK
ncbi:MAG: hypothetical protein EOP84_01585 [Verrucomicrobiaceae bacterium]|nr:MAG: hypothetical protein EOP84_01585 [Verrucomicrobiaceae bacterium]